MFSKRERISHETYSIFQNKFLEYRVTLANNNNSSVLETLTLKDYCSSVGISCHGGMTLGQAVVNIYNIEESFACKLMAFSQYPLHSAGKNRLEIFASTDKNPHVPLSISRIFDGGIYNAHLNNDAAPTPVLSLIAQSGLRGSGILVSDTVFKGTVAVEAILREIVRKLVTVMGAAWSEYGAEITVFENHGVTSVETNPYYSGDPIMQIRSVTRNHRLRFKMENNVFAIWPINSSYVSVGEEKNGLIFSPQTGLIGAPYFNGQNIVIRSIFRPELRYGQKIRIKSPSIGEVVFPYMVSLRHSLSQNIPKGPWESTAILSNIELRG